MPNSTNSWIDAIVPVHSTLRDVIQNLNQTGLQISLITDDTRRLVGILSDGDIRRSLLRGLTLTSPVTEILNPAPLLATPDLNKEAVLLLMRNNRVRQLPIVDQDGHIVGLHCWDNLMIPEARPNSMVIMAGGKGTRLRPHTETCPKPMLPVDGKPMLEHIITRAKRDGFQHFVLAIHYLGHMIEDYFGDGRNFDVHIDYLRENSPLGTAGALSLLSPTPEHPFLVTNGDVLSEIRYSEILDFHCHHNAIATMAVRLHEWQHPFGVVRTSGLDITGFEEKPITITHINAGIYALSPSALQSLEPGGYCDMPSWFDKLRSTGHRTIAFPMHEPWLDVGREEDYIAANKLHPYKKP